MHSKWQDCLKQKRRKMCLLCLKKTLDIYIKDATLTRLQVGERGKAGHLYPGISFQRTL